MAQMCLQLTDLSRVSFDRLLNEFCCLKSINIETVVYLCVGWSHSCWLHWLQLLQLFKPISSVLKNYIYVLRCHWRFLDSLLPLMLHLFFFLNNILDSVCKHWMRVLKEDLEGWVCVKIMSSVRESSTLMKDCFNVSTTAATLVFWTKCQ